MNSRTPRHDPVKGQGAAAGSPTEPFPVAVLPEPERWRFETLLANLSATFVNVSAAEVDSQIESGLKQIVEFLDFDRSGLGERSPEGMVITHSYERPGVPPSPRVVLEAQFPFYAKKVHEGEVFRLPDDLPPDWDPFFELDPPWTEAFIAAGAPVYIGHVFAPKLAELLSIAFDASITHMYAPGTRRHIKAALKHGATMEEIMEVLKICVAEGAQACNLGLPILAEELASRSANADRR